ncbi:hypothetical protein AAZV13_13G050000 [Glycine max]
MSIPIKLGFYFPHLPICFLHEKNSLLEPKTQHSQPTPYRPLHRRKTPQTHPLPSFASSQDTPNPSPSYVVLILVRQSSLRPNPNTATLTICIPTLCAPTP